MRISIVLGTRPEVIKLSPVIRECQRRDLDFFILHTGQHYSYRMDRVFFEQLQLPDARYNLEVGSGSHAEQTGKMLAAIEKILKEERPDIVLVEGDTNTVLAGALAAAKLNIRVAHAEAGLRSYDRRMPEEINRILTDHCSDLLFAPTEKSRQTLIHEGITKDKIFVTGNTIVDAVKQNLKIAVEGSDIRNRLRLRSHGYLLATVHRQENVSDDRRLRAIMRGLQLVSQEYGLPVLCPFHPNTRKQMKKLHVKTENLRVVEPLDYLSFLVLESTARLILTDSGGVQEEACILRVPCVTLRNNTERPETLEVGANVIAGTDPHQILDKTKLMLNEPNRWMNPFGDGTAAQKIVKALGQKRFTHDYSGSPRKSTNTLQEAR
jgi:UDP-N-acetylglucosamine 2-epimerase (non-hydrolysing)